LSRTYKIKEMFLSLQGEGPHTGLPVLFVRFSGCNLWSGREEDRSKGKGSCALFCDTDFVGTDGHLGGVFSASSLIDAIDAALDGRSWPIVFTGGEPLLQLDMGLVDELKDAGFSCHVETNGTVRPLHIEGTLLDHFDCVVMSPKAGPRAINLSPHDVSAVKVILTPEHDDDFLAQFSRWKKINAGNHHHAQE